MPLPSDNGDTWDLLQQKIIGLGEQSARKSYYPELQQRLQELENARRDLSRLNAQLQAVMDSATEVAIISTDSTGTITMFNRGAEKMLGYRAGEMVGIATPLLFHRADEVAAHARILTASYGRTIAGFDVFVERARSEGFDKHEWTYIKKDGTCLLVELVVTVMRHATGEVAGYLGIAQNITDRKIAQAELQENACMLEQEIADRRLAQEQLVAKQRELQAINESLEARIAAGIAELRAKDEMLLHQSRLAAMGELLHCIAHQWRQPLNNIAARLQMMQYLKDQEELTGEEMDRDIACVLEILASMSGTINDFRNFYRSESLPEQFSLHSVLERTLSLVDASFAEAHIKISLTVKDTPTGQGSPNEYAQILLHIINNARDVLLERNIVDPQISIVLSQEENRSVVTIEDNGGGIRADVMPHIFDPYFSTKGPAQGSGIGLYMSKMIIERTMGGTLRVRNTGQGAEFRIALPAPDHARVTERLQKEVHHEDQAS